jgi:anionic cell wall polymer biosynthesis LytR-Cps2A-Psr (LCP) family protein
LTDVDVYSNGQWVGTKQMQLCLAYAYGDGSSLSCENSVTSISRVLYNVPIEKYFALDLDGIAPLNDAIGGVTVNSLYDFPDYGIKTGDEITIKGDMAEAYVRTRDINGNLNASLDRTKRQMQYIKAYSSQLLPAVMKDFSVVSSLYNTASKYSQTNLTVNNATYLASLMLSKGTTDFDTYSLEGEMIEQDASDSDFPDAVYAQFVPDEDSLMQTVLDVFYNQVS